MQEILDIFLEKSKQHHSNIIYAQIYKNECFKRRIQAFSGKNPIKYMVYQQAFCCHGCWYRRTRRTDHS